MKTLLRWFSVIGGLAAMFLLARTFVAPDTAAPPASPAAQAVFAALPVDAERVVDLDFDDAAVEARSLREQRDQALDWLLMTVLSEAGLDARQFDEATFDLPASRIGYLKPVAGFEYGSIRSRALPDGRVVVLLPSGLTDGERKDNLAAAFDEQRKNLGEVPGSLLVFEYAYDAARQQARLVRRADVPGTLLLQAGYGYAEATIANLTDLQALMAAVDDVCAVRIEGQALRVGGRRLQGHRYRGIRPEDVAALWQSERGLATKRKAFDAHWEAEYARANEHARATGMSRAEADALGHTLARRMAEDARAQGAMDHSGFSLDPDVDYAALQPAFERFVHQARALSGGPGPASLAAARDAITQRNVVPMLKLLDGMQHGADRAAASLASEFSMMFELRLRYQASRYDGDLAGTEVGMNLFYTDLLAKLWALDFQSSTPQRSIPDFLSLGKVVASPVFEQEIRERSSTRLWFGHQDQGFQILAKDGGVLFARNATRVYAASSSPLEPGRETEPNAESEQFLGWWNDHFEEVARYEQEYERLNQIMKWSAVIGWLNAGAQGERLGFLAEVPVDRKQWFPDWVAAHRELRFDLWKDVGFHAPQRMGRKTESMPILAWSYVNERDRGTLTGGVSLAPRQLFEKRAALDTALDRTLRRSGLDYAHRGEELTTLSRASYKFGSTAQAPGPLLATPRAGARLRSRGGELRWGATERSVTHQPGRLTMDTRVRGNSLGELTIDRQAQGFRIAWRAREVDAGQALARRASRAADTLVALRADPEVQALLLLQDGQVAVRMRGQQRWFKLSEETAASADMPQGVDARVADAGSRRIMHLEWIADPRTLVQGVADDALLVVERGGPRSPVRLRFVPTGDAAAPGAAVTIEHAGVSIAATRSADQASTRLRWSDLAKQMPDDPLALAQRIGRADTEGAAARVTLDGVSSEAPLLQGLRSGDRALAAREIAKDPAAAARHLQDALAEGVTIADALAQQGRALRAGQVLDDLIALHGPLPELTLRKGLAQLQRQRHARAADTLADTAQAPLRDPQALLAEIESRIARAQTPHHAGQLERVRDLVRWRQSGGAARGTAERLSLTAQDDALMLGLHLQRAKLEPMVADDLAQALPRNTLLYVQDSPGLNNLDFTVSVQALMAQLPSGRLPRVLNLGQQSIADFRPDLLYVGDAQVPFKLLNKQRGMELAKGGRNLNGRSRCDQEPDRPDCREREPPPAVVLVQ